MARLKFEDIIPDIINDSNVGSELQEKVFYEHYKTIRREITNGIKKDIKLDYLIKIKPNVINIEKRELKRKEQL